MTTTSPAATAGRLLHRPAETGPAYWGPGDRYTFLVTGEESGGAYFAMEAYLPPGGGPPPHIHTREDETLEPAPTGSQDVPDNVEEVAARCVDAAPRYGMKFV